MQSSSHAHPPSLRPSFSVNSFSLGLAPNVTTVNLVTFLVHCASSILFLVFLNSTQPFVIHQLNHQKPHHSDRYDRQAGTLSGTLIFFDELISTVASLFWGASADMYGVASVAALSYLFIGLGIASYTLPRQPWPGLLVSRLIFAFGGSGATAMLSAILTKYALDSTHLKQPSGSNTVERGAEFSAQTDVRCHESETVVTVQPEINAEQQSALIQAHHSDLQSYSDESHSKHDKVNTHHGKLAALAGVFTGLGALIAVFGLLRLPQTLARYFDRQPQSGRDHTDSSLRSATIVTYWLVASLSLVISVVVFFGLRETESNTNVSQRRNMPVRARYGSINGHIHPAAVLPANPREARRDRMRQRLRRRESQSWITRFRQHSREFCRAAMGGFRMAAPVKKAIGLSATTYHLRSNLALELRMAYLGGALARAFTIGTTAFLPLLVAHHYFESGLCRDLPSSDPSSPIPPDSLNKLCRSAFTATAILGGTVQLTALVFSPAVGVLCDRFSPTQTMTFTSLIGAVGFAVLGMATSGFGKDSVPFADPVTTTSIFSAVAVGIGQIGAIVASLASCARAKSLIAADLGQAPNGNHGQQEEAGRGEGDYNPSSSPSSSSPIIATRPNTQPLTTELGKGIGAIAGAYTSTGSLSILLVSQLGGYLFDLYPPLPFLLLAGLSTLVAFVGLWTSFLGVSNPSRSVRLE